MIKKINIISPAGTKIPALLDESKQIIIFCYATVEMTKRLGYKIERVEDEQGTN